MEFDEIKSAWQSLDRSLQAAHALDLQQLRDRKLDRARGSLRPLAWGQILQIVFGAAFLALAALLWASQPTHASTIVAGVLVHAYGVVTIICAGVVLSQIGELDYAAPVLDIQKQLLRMRTFYIRSGMLAGLPWWFLWVPLLMLLSGLNDVSLLAKAPALVWSGLTIGAAGLLATWWFHRWARRPERAAFGQRMDDSLTGGSLRKALAQVDELRRFERE